MSDSTPLTAPCPLCGKAIVIGNAYWRCPCCNAETNSWDPLSVCANCGFAPAYFDCPGCARGFDIGLLFGNVHASDGFRMAPKPKPQIRGGITHNLKELPLFQAGSLVEDKSWGMAITAIVPHLENLTFSFPCRIRSYEMLRGRSSSDGRRWLHFFLYADAEASNDQKVGLLSVCASPAPEDGGFSVSIAVLEALPRASEFISG